MYDQCLKSLITGILKEELYEKTYQEATKWMVGTYP
jgi:hypothetical protein